MRNILGDNRLVNKTSVLLVPFDPIAFEGHDFEGMSLIEDSVATESNTDASNCTLETFSKALQADLIVNKTYESTNGQISRKIAVEMAVLLDENLLREPEYYTTDLSDTLAVESWETIKEKSKSALKAAKKGIVSALNLAGDKYVEFRDRNANKTDNIIKIVKGLELVIAKIEETEDGMPTKSKMEASKRRSEIFNKDTKKYTKAVRSIVLGGSDYAQATDELIMIDSLILDEVRMMAGDSDYSPDTEAADAAMMEYVSKWEGSLNSITAEAMAKDPLEAMSRYVSHVKDFRKLNWVTRDIIKDGIDEVAKSMDDNSDAGKAQIAFIKLLNTYMNIRYRIISDTDNLGELLLRGGLKSLKAYDGEQHKETATALKAL